VRALTGFLLDDFLRIIEAAAALRFAIVMSIGDFGRAAPFRAASRTSFSVMALQTQTIMERIYR